MREALPLVLGAFVGAFVLASLRHDLRALWAHLQRILEELDRTP